MGIALFALVLWAFCAFASRRVALGLTILVYWLGSFDIDSSHPGWILRYFLPQFYLYQRGFSPQLSSEIVLQMLLVGGSHLMFWGGSLWYVRRLCARDEEA